MSVAMKRSIGNLCFFLLLALTVFGAACTTAPIDENDPAALYKDAEDEIQSDHYLVAIEKLKNIKNRFPYSKYSLEAHLRVADIYFLQEQFDEAAATYESFRDLHPKHPKGAYALFRIGKSYFNSIPSQIDRDLTSAEKSLEIYESFLRAYPTAEETAEARQDISKLRDLLSKKELLIADFYFKRKIYHSAKNRYKKILDLYPDTEAAKNAKQKLEIISSSDSKTGETQ